MMSNEGSDISDLDPPTELSNSEVISTPQENSLLMKSREQYQTLYRRFMEWKEANNKKSLTEEVFMDYFKELAEKMKPSTLWSQFSMLKYTMGVNENIDMNRFDELRSFLRTKSVGYKSKSSNVFTSRQIEMFLTDATDAQFLAEKVALIFGIIGACRSHELVHISVDNIEDDGTMAQVTIPKTESDPERTFTICGEFYKIYKRYAVLRPKRTDCSRFFLSYRNGRCVNQVIGLHKFGGMPKQIATFLNLPDPDGYTGHTFRRTSASLLAESGADWRTLQRHVGGNSKIAKDLIEEKRRNKIRISKQITGCVFLKPSTSTSSDNSQPRVPIEDVHLPSGSGSGGVDPLFIDCNDNAAIKEEHVEEIVELEEISIEDEKKNNPGDLFVEQEAILTAEETNVQSQESGKPSVGQPVVEMVSKPVIRLQSRQNLGGRYLRKIEPKRVVKTIERGQAPSPVIQKISETRGAGTQSVPQIIPPSAPQRSPEVCLKWGHYHTNIQTSFPSFLNSEDFVDVTLACEGRSLKCHKVILSSCSEYLSSLLRENPCQHPIILMKDLKFWEIEALVKFMYKGEVNIPHVKLPRLLKAAKALQVKGLANFSLGETPPPPMVPTLTPQKPKSTSAAVPKAPEPKTPKQPIKTPPTTQLSTKRAIKRPIELKKSNNPPIATKYPKERAHTPPPLRSLSPEIKVESLDINTDIFPMTTVNSSTQEFENFVTLNETLDNDPGGNNPPEPGDDVQHQAQDMDDVQEQMDLVLTDFLQQENHFLGINSENSQSVPPDDEHEQLNKKDGT